MSQGTQIIEAIRADPKIPAPSQTVFKVLELTKDPECDIKRIGAVIQKDAGLTGQLLRQANSALYGFSSPTSSVVEACTRIGLKRVRSAVINQHVVSGLGRAKPPGFDPQRYWQGAFATSVAAHDLCRDISLGTEEDAGTAGLLCDIGIGLMAYGIPQRYLPVLKQIPDGDYAELSKIERRLLGVDHSEVAAAILADWKLDAPIIAAVRSHHADPLDQSASEMSRFSRCVAAAVVLSEIALIGSDMDRVSLLFAHVDALSSDADALVQRLLDNLVTHIQKSATSLSVELGSTDEMEANFENLIRDMPDVGQQMSFRPMDRHEIT